LGFRLLREAARTSRLSECGNNWFPLHWSWWGPGCGGWRTRRGQRQSLLFNRFRFDWPNVDVSSKRRHILPSFCVRHNLGHPPIRHRVGGNDRLGSPVSLLSKRSWATVAAILSLSQVTLTGGIRRPGAICCADGVDVRTSVAVKLALLVDEPDCTVAWNARTKSRHLLFHARIMFYAPRNIRPRSVLLAEGDIIPSSAAHHIAKRSWKGLRAIPWEPWARREGRDGRRRQPQAGCH